MPLRRLFDRGTREQVSQPVGEPSIYDHIKAHLAAVGLTEEGYDLPSDEPEEDDFRWAPGALEGVFTRHMEADEDATASAEIHAALVALSHAPSDRTRERVREAALAASPRRDIDRVLTLLQADEPPSDQGELLNQVYLLARTTRDVPVAKISIGVIGLYGLTETADLLRTFARHDEFTMYAAIALANAYPDSYVDEWLALAPHVTGWGRVELVTLLLQQEPRADVHAFLLLEGFQNSVHGGYNALDIAVVCDLKGELERDDVAAALIGAARDIVGTLAEDAVTGGPAGDLLDYEDGVAVTTRLLELIEPKSLVDYGPLSSLLQFLDSDAEPSYERREDGTHQLEAVNRWELRGWTPEVKARLAARCRALLDEPDWPALIEQGFANEESDSYLPAYVASQVGYDITGHLIARLERDPTDSTAWWYLAEGDYDEEKAATVLELGRRLLDFEDVARSSNFSHTLILEHLMNAVCPEPGEGQDLVRASLNSKQARIRNVAIWKLGAWQSSGWELDDDFRSLLGARAAQDPEESTRELAGRALRGESLDDPDLFSVEE